MEGNSRAVDGAGRSIRVAVVGAGWIARVAHLPAWNRSGASVTWVVDTDPTRAEAAAREFNIEHWSTDYSDALKDEEVSAVDICVLPGAHLEITTAALAAGKHVLVEKPFVLALDEAREMVRCARAYPKQVVMVAENWPYSTMGSSLIREVRAGAVGDPLLLKGSHESNLYNYEDALPKGLNPTDNGGGTTMTAGIHVINLARELVGDFRSVAAYAIGTERDGYYVDTTTAISFKSSQGVVGVLDFTGRSQRLGQRKLALELFGTKGVIAGDVLTGDYEVTSTDGFRAPASEYPLLEVEGRRAAFATSNVTLGFHEEIAEFCSRISSSADSTRELLAHCSTLATVLAIYRSIQTRAEVEPLDLLAEAKLITGEEEEIG